jgi:hypothetical protein
MEFKSPVGVTDSVFVNTDAVSAKKALIVAF